MKMPTGKIKSDTTVTKKAIYLLIIQIRRRKGMAMTKSPSPANKVKPLLKICLKI